MAIRIVEIISSKKEYPEIAKLLQQLDIKDSWEVADLNQQNVIISIPIALEKSQIFLDDLQSKIDNKNIKKIVVTSAEAILPEEEFYSPTNPSVPREELYNQLLNNSNLNSDFVFLTLFSTIVAALGLLENSVIAVIAAMVIAPMLMPNLAASLAVVLGDFKLLFKATKTNFIGIIVCLVFSIIFGFFWPNDMSLSALLLQRASPSYSSIVLALVSGAAGALSLTSRSSSILVGVMVAVALLPPLVATGIFLGTGDFSKSIYAGILFFINIVCVNLSANLVFLLKGIHPQRWYDKKKAKKAIFWYLLFWVVSLFLLWVVIYFHLHALV